MAKGERPREDATPLAGRLEAFFDRPDLSASPSDDNVAGADLVGFLKDSEGDIVDSFPVVSQRGLADLLSLGGVAGVIEIFTGLLLLAGLFTRVAAFVLSGTMAAAYFIGHAPRGWFPIENDGELAIMFCFTLLLISAAGPGAFSIDKRCVQ